MQRMALSSNSGGSSSKSNILPTENVVCSSSVMASEAAERLISSNTEGAISINNVNSSVISNCPQHELSIDCNVSTVNEHKDNQTLESNSCTCNTTCVNGSETNI